MEIVAVQGFHLPDVSYYTQPIVSKCMLNALTITANMVQYKNH